ncbi:MAG TPA: hypothetical protein VH082_06105 [Rudaea sp.]|jgi:hypothetical protein|nr:hypothetical protein [Rudaea sp.]
MRIRLIFVACVLSILSGCGSGRLHPINPPNASIQQLDVLPDGRWKIQIRLENFSDKTVHYTNVKASLRVGGEPATDISLNADMDVPGENADTIDTAFTPSAAAAKALATDVKLPGGASYELKGTITIPAADKDFKFEHKSRLSPVPGIANQYR